MRIRFKISVWAIPVLAMSILLTGSVFSGNLDQTNPPVTSVGAMSTLTDIYNCLNTGNCAAKRTGTFVEPSGAPGSTGYTLDDIMNLAKQRARVPRTGQTSCWDAAGTLISCTGTSQDGEKLKGVANPSPRFTDNGNGTATDNLTGLVWLKNANCFGTRTWTQALSDANDLANGDCGLTDGSTAGQWRLPNVKELQSLNDFQNYYPYLPTGHPFSSLQSGSYWSATTYVTSKSFAFTESPYGAFVSYDLKSHTYYVLPVR